MASTELVAPLFEGPLDIVGDVHGELEVLRDLMNRLGYDSAGEHPGGRRLVFLGDLCDRGPDSPGVIELVRSMIERDRARCILGNHELNVLRNDRKPGNAWYFDEQHPWFEAERAHSRPAPRGHAYHEFLLTLPLVLERDDLRLVHAAATLRPRRSSCSSTTSARRTSTWSSPGSPRRRRPRRSSTGPRSPTSRRRHRCWRTSDATTSASRS